MFKSGYLVVIGGVDGGLDYWEGVVYRFLYERYERLERNEHAKNRGDIGSIKKETCIFVKTKV